MKVPLWLMIIIISRDIILGITALILLNFIDIRSYHVTPSMLGKITTVLQILTVLLVLLGKKGPLVTTTFWITAFATIASGLHYVYRESKIFRA
jgi:cardiolipin synthase